MSVVVVATIVPKPEHRHEVIEALSATIEQVHGEDGCELYALHEAPDRLVLIEKWGSADALGVHGKSKAIADLYPKLTGKIDPAPPLVILQPVPAGDTTKGQL